MEQGELLGNGKVRESYRSFSSIPTLFYSMHELLGDLDVRGLISNIQLRNVIWQNINIL